MTALLAFVTVAAWGTWIPLAQLVPGVPQRSRACYATVGNLLVAGVALLAGGGHLEFGWRGFWLPLAGGVVWTAGNYSAFRATETIGLARAAGTWAPLNIIVAFAWGALLFGELDHFSRAHFAVVGIALLAVMAGMLLITGARDSAAAAPSPDAPAMAGQETPAGSRRSGGAAAEASPREPAATRSRGGALAEARQRAPAAGGLRGGLLWAIAAGILWGSYFIPAQWAAVPAQVSNFPLAIGMLGAGLALALPAGEPVRLGRRALSAQLGAGVLFGIGDLTLLGLVSRVGTGAGFTIGQLSLLVNASIGIWFFHVPKPGTRQARMALAGILVAGAGGCVIGALR